MKKQTLLLFSLMLLALLFSCDFNNNSKSNSSYEKIKKENDSIKKILKSYSSNTKNDSINFELLKVIPVVSLKLERVELQNNLGGIPFLTPLIKRNVENNEITGYSIFFFTEGEIPSIKSKRISRNNTRNKIKYEVSYSNIEEDYVYLNTFILDKNNFNNPNAATMYEEFRLRIHGFARLKIKIESTLKIDKDNFIKRTGIATTTNEEEDGGPGMIKH